MNSFHPERAAIQAATLAHYAGQAALCSYTSIAALLGRMEAAPTRDELKALIAAVAVQADKLDTPDVVGADDVTAHLTMAMDAVDEISIGAGFFCPEFSRELDRDCRGVDVVESTFGAFIAAGGMA